MITVLPYDAGTLPVRAVSHVPGCDLGYYREADFEEGQTEDRHEAQNAAMRVVTPWPMRPWLEPMPGKMWVDVDRRHQAEGDEGLRFNLYHRDSLDDAFSLVPAGAGRLKLAPQPELEPTDAAVTSELGRSEVTQRSTEWDELVCRLDTLNESGGTALREPLLLVWDGLCGPAYRLELADNTLFAPFDLRRGLEGYLGVDAAGVPLLDEAAQAWLDLTVRGRYALYLRPRRWRWVVTVLAHFFTVSAFESYPNDELFIRTYFDRPPVYPWRHDVVHTSQVTDLEDFWGNRRSYDQGVEWSFDHSREAASLRSEIVGQQYTMGACFAYILLGCEAPVITLWRHPPRVGEIVLGLGRLDLATGAEDSRVWFVQRAVAQVLYPPTIIGEYLAPSFNVWA